MIEQRHANTERTTLEMLQMLDIPAPYYLLPYVEGTQLDDSRTLADYNIGRNTTLALEKMVNVTIRDSLHPPNCIRLKVTRCPCPPVRTQCHLQLIHNF
jgi:hypothetical protein